MITTHSNYSNKYSNYMHTYEAFRIPKGHEALDPKKVKNTDLVKSEDGSILILTEKSQKQLIKDRFAFGGMIQADAQKAAQESQMEGMKQYYQNQAKALSVFRSMSKGDTVPSTDEKKLMEFNDKLYQAAKMAQAMARQLEKNQEKRESQWDEKEEAENKERQDKLNEKATELARNIGNESHMFANAQEKAVKEIDASSVNLSAITAYTKLSGNLGGAIFEASF